MLNNIVGLKPSLGLVPTQGVVPACRSLDCVSVFALTVADAAAVLEVMAGVAPADRYSRAAPPAGAPRRGAAGWRLAAPLAGQLVFDSPDDAALYDAALARAEALGGTVTRVDIAPFLAIARRLYDGAWVAERTAALRELLAAKPEAIHPVTRGILEAGLDKRTSMPGTTSTPPPRPAGWPGCCSPGPTSCCCRPRPARRCWPTWPPSRWRPNSRLGTYTNFVNICDLAALAVPSGFRADGRPVGVTLVGPAFAEARLAGLGAALHAAAGVTLGATGAPIPPPPAPPALAPGEIPLLAIGAHMAGLPLNPQMLRHGGRFVTAARTAPLYRFHDLGNRPGLVRVADGGVAIAGEVWAFPAAGIGPFLAEIPPPLGFGRVTLEDGSTPLGFLCEAAGVIGTPDISATGGWRAHIKAKEQG